MAGSPLVSERGLTDAAIARRPSSRPYRQKAEIFRDLLLAADRPGSRSKIARRANVSLRVLERYLDSCVTFGWMQSDGPRYFATAEGRLAAHRIDGLLQKMRLLREVEGQLQGLLRSGDSVRRLSTVPSYFARSGGIAPPRGP